MILAVSHVAHFNAKKFIIHLVVFEEFICDDSRMSLLQVAYDLRSESFPSFSFYASIAIAFSTFSITRRRLGEIKLLKFQEAFKESYFC